MAHNINKNNGKYSYVGKDSAWHQLGTVLERSFTSKEALEEGGLDFEVEKIPVFYNYNDKIIKPKDNYALVRKDKDNASGYLGSCGSNYKPIQNEQLFSFFDFLVDEKQAIYEVAGAIGNGERVWILAKLPSNIVIGKNKDDVVDKYILLTNAHTGKHAATAMITPIRVVCENTLNMALGWGSSNFVRIIHTENAKEKLQMAHELMEFSTIYYDKLSESFNNMSLSKITDKQLVDYVNKIIFTEKEMKDFENVSTRKKNQVSKILDLYDNGAGSEFSKGTVWGAFNAVTEFYDHYFVNESAISYNDKLLSNIWYGTAKQRKQTAMKLAVELS